MYDMLIAYASCVMTFQNREVCLCFKVDCLYLNCCWHKFQSFCEKNDLAHNHIDVYCLLAPSKIREISVLLVAYFFCLFKKLLGQELSKCLCKN